MLFALCCGEVALIFGILGVALCRDATARRNAIVVLTVGLVRFCLVLVSVVAQNAANLAR